MSVYGGVEEFFDKIEYEGGDYAALEYGLTAEGYDLSREMADDWAEIVSQFGALDEKLKRFFKRYRPEEMEW